MVVVAGRRKNSFACVPFLNDVNCHRDPRRVWGILVYNLMHDADSLLSGKSISSLSHSLTRHSLFFALSDWNKGKT